MIPQLVASAVKNPRTTVALWGVFVAATGVLAVRLQLDALPDLTNNQVQILTTAPGLTPDEVELRVTRPLETALGGLPGLIHHRSISRYGLSAVTAIFDDDVDRFRARQQVGERLQAIAGVLPAGVLAPELGPMTGGLGEVFQFTVSSKTRSAADLLELVNLRLVPLLRAVPGIVEINPWGGERRTFDIRADPVRLAQRGLTLGQVTEAIRQATGAVPGAALSAGPGQVLLRGAFRPTDPAALGLAIVGRGPGAELVRVADVADVRMGALPRLGAATANGQGETVYVMAQMLTGANARDVTHGVRARMDVVRKLLPPDVQVEVVYDRARLVDGTLKTVGKNLLEGGLLVMLVLFATLGSLRAGVIIALCIPVSMLGATATMVLLGIPGNLLSLGAIDFGLLVDGAVVLVEHVFQVLVSSDKNTPFADRVRHASRPVAWPVFASVLVILLVYVPVLSLTGVDGTMFRPMALAVVFALATALFASLTLVPAAVAWGLKDQHLPKRDTLLVRIVQTVHDRVLTKMSPHRIATATLSILLLVGAGVLFVRAGTELVPQLDEGDLVIQTTRAPDLSLTGAIAQASTMERALLQAIPEIQRIASRIGSPAIATDIMGLEQADVFVGLRPREQWRPGLTRDALIAGMTIVINRATPNSDPAFTQPIQMRFNELLGGSPTDVVVSVFGDDLTILRQLGDQLVTALSPIPGVSDLRVLAPPSVSLLDVEPRPLDAGLWGLSVGEILLAVQSVRLGVQVGTTYLGPVAVPLVLRLGDGSSSADLENLGLPTPAGQIVALSQVATLHRRDTPSLVQHDLGQRRLLVGFNVRKADLGTVAGQAQDRAEKIRLPDGYRLTWGGQLETLTQATDRLVLVVPLVLLLILALLLLTFRSLRHALIVLSHVPFACVGGMATLSLRDLPFSISAAIGFIALSGIAVMNGVVLLGRVRDNEANGLPPGTAALQAARTRVRPVTMTALVAALGFVPMMMATGVGSEVQRPLATVVCGGLVTSTLLTLLILPTLYPWFAARTRTLPS